ncbi:MAG: hypothetical protein ABIZ80_10925, partial [Bryobacteraceae bacterium]
MRVIAATGSSATDLRRKPGLNLPPELLDKAVSRLYAISILGAVAAIVMSVLHGFLQPEVAEVQKLPLVRLLTLGLVLFCVAFFGMHRSGWFSKQTILHCGVAFQIVMTFMIGMFETSVPMDSTYVVRGVSVVALWVTLCSLLIPSAPLVNLATNFASAVSWPLGLVLSTGVRGDLGQRPEPPDVQDAARRTEGRGAWKLPARFHDRP